MNVTCMNTVRDKCKMCSPHYGMVTGVSPIHHGDILCRAIIILYPRLEIMVTGTC